MGRPPKRLQEINSVKRRQTIMEEYALELAKAASLRSEDPFVKVGACALNHENMVVGVGYNGLPSEPV